MTIYDRYTRWTTAIPIPNMTAETVAKAFMHGWVSNYGVPAYISTDSARIFCGVIWTKLTQLLGCKSIRTSPRRPESNSGIERYHRSLKGAIMTHLNNRSWLDALPIVLLGLRTALKEDMGCSSSDMVFGQSLSLPNDIVLKQRGDINTP